MMNRFTEVPPRDIWAHLASFIGRFYGIHQLFTLMISSWSASESSNVQILRSSAWRRERLEITSVRSFIQTRKRSGPRTEPWGTPEWTEAGDNSVWSTLTQKDRPVRKELIHCRSSPQTPWTCNLWRGGLWETLSNALAKSKKIVSEMSPSSLFWVRLFI